MLAAPSLPPRANPAHGQGGYRRHTPEDTVLYSLVREHLGAFLDYAHERNGRPLPKYVRDEFFHYLNCGLLSEGFCRARCRDCTQELLIPFSCKNRGVCPSCSARRMCAEAAYLVECVLPDVPLRQWSVTFPYELRLILAANAAALAHVHRIAIEEIQRSYERRALYVGVLEPKAGSVTFVHRFGGSMNLHVHLHIAAIDGVFEAAIAPAPVGDRPMPDSQTPKFHALEPPSPAEITNVVERVAKRVTRWARRKGLALTGPFDVVDDPDPSIQLVRLGASRGQFATIAGDGRTLLPDDESEFAPRRSSPMSATHEQFNVHAGVSVPAGDREARERLCRYGARPPFSLERLSVLDDGRVAYRVKYPGPRGHTHRLMEPLEFMARLSAIIPPPRYPLTRYGGVLAPNAPLRKHIVPGNGRPRRPKLEVMRRGASASAKPAGMCDAPHDATNTCAGEGLGHTSREAVAVIAPPDAENANGVPPASNGVESIAERGEPANVQGGAERESRDSSYIDWATLLRRTYGVDALSCAGCGGRIEMLAVITRRGAIEKILRHLGESPTGPPPPRLTSPWPVDST